MKILERQKLNIKKKYVLGAAIVLSLIIVLQASSNTLKIAVSDIIYFIANYSFWALLIEYIYGAIKPFNIPLKFKSQQVFRAFISLLILVVVHLVLTNIIYYSFVILTSNIGVIEAFNNFKPFILKSFFSRWLDLSVIIVLLKILETYFTVQKQKVQMLLLENELKIAQLETLRWQLNPHFLFNSLHTLNSLIGYDDKRAQEMVIKITGLFRKMLSQKEVHLIPFEEELEYFKNYLEIEQERFYDRLNVNLEIEKEVYNIFVPTLILQPLIENAFKHGISRIEGKGNIHLKASITERQLIITISNTIPKEGIVSKPLSTKVGLLNLINRLDKVYGENYEFSTIKDKKLFTAIIKINKKESL